MKRELAALEIDSPSPVKNAMESVGAGKTRSSSSISKHVECVRVRVPDRLVYKRTRRSLHVIPTTTTTNNVIITNSNNSRSIALEKKDSAVANKDDKSHNQNTPQITTEDQSLVGVGPTMELSLPEPVVKRFTRSVLKSKPATTQPQPVVVPNVDETMAAELNAQVDQQAAATCSPIPTAVDDDNGSFKPQVEGLIKPADDQLMGPTMELVLPEPEPEPEHEHEHEHEPVGNNLEDNTPMNVVVVEEKELNKSSVVKWFTRSALKSKPTTTETTVVRLPNVDDAMAAEPNAQVEHAAAPCTQIPISGDGDDDDDGPLKPQVEDLIEPADSVTPDKTHMNDGNVAVDKEEVNNSAVVKRFTRSALKSKPTTTQPQPVVPLPNVDEAVAIEPNGQVPMDVDDDDGPLKPQVEGLIESTDYAALDETHGNDGDVFENGVEQSMSATPKKKLEMKMSKHIALANNVPTTVKELFETGLLEGCPVYYNGGKGPGLQGRIRALGILCSCGVCQGSKVIPPSLFEIHACNSYKRAVQYICLENGRSFIQILKECKNTRLSTLEATVENAIGPLPERKLRVCLNCKEPFYTMDAETSEPVCSSCVMSNACPIGPVFSYRRTCRSSKCLSPSTPTEAASSRPMLRDRSTDKLIEKSSKGSTMSSLQSSPRSPEVPLLPRARSRTRFEKSSETKTTSKKAKTSLEACLTPNLRSSPRFGKSFKAKVDERLQVSMELNTFHSSSSQKSSEAMTCQKPGNKLLSPKLLGSNHVGKLLRANDHGKRKRLKKGLMSSKSSKSPAVGSSSEKRVSGKITKKDQRQHRLVFEDDVLPDGTELGYYARGQKLLDGYKKGSGIFCYCCNTVVSASQFEAHAGCAARKKPYCYIYTSNGVSLHELSVNLIKGRTHSAKYNDDLCSICADGGNLLLCDGCPRSFHMQCASLPSLPRGKWYCKYCQSMFEREKFVAHNINAVAAGRVSGVDPIEQITERSIRIVDKLASDVSSCILCRGYDFCKSGFGPRTIILCDQCEKEYHVGCLKDHKMADLSELPKGKWFCSMECQRIDSALQGLLNQGAEKLPESLVNIIRKKCVETDPVGATDFDISWRLLSGKIASPETKPLLAQAVAIFHESFAPIIDAVSGRDLIPAMVYGRNVAGQEYDGMYCAVLTINSVVVSAGIFRVFGTQVAELPLVATSAGNHGKGYFQALFARIESVLAFLQVRSFVLPAAEEAESIWTDRFGFAKMTPDQLVEFKRNYWSMVRFQGTSMLHKLIPDSCDSLKLSDPVNQKHEVMPVS